MCEAREFQNDHSRLLGLSESGSRGNIRSQRWGLTALLRQDKSSTHFSKINTPAVTSYNLRLCHSLLMCLFHFDISQSGDSEQSRHLGDTWATRKGWTGDGSGIPTCMSLNKGYVSHGQRRAWQKPDISCLFLTLILPIRVVCWDLFSSRTKSLTSKWLQCLWHGLKFHLHVWICVELEIALLPLNHLQWN